MYRNIGILGSGIQWAGSSAVRQLKTILAHSAATESVSPRTFATVIRNLARGIRPVDWRGRQSQHARARALPGKLLAQTPPLSQGPRPMNSSGRSQTCARVFVAAVLFAAFSWTLLVSVSPRLHARIHDDANRADHVCAITLIGSGSYEHGAQPSLVSRTAPSRSIFQNSGVNPVLGSVAVSWRAHLRACAACARLAR